MSMGKTTIVNIAIICIITYIVFHTIYGNRGILSYLKLRHSVAHMKQNLNLLSVERLTLENIVSNLSTEKIDKDLIDEQARQILFLSHIDEEVIINDKE